MSVFPEIPIKSPLSFGTIDGPIETSPLPEQSMTSTIFGLPSVVTDKPTAPGSTPMEEHVKAVLVCVAV